MNGNNWSLSVSSISSKMSESLSCKSIGGITVGSAPVIVDANNTILLANGSIVQSVSLETGALTGSYNGHSNLVTSIVQNALCNRIFKAGNSKDEIVVSTSLDGSVLVWDVNTFRTVAKYELNQPVMSISFHPKTASGKLPDHERYVACVVVAKQEDEYSVVQYELLSLDVAEFKINRLPALSLPFNHNINYLSFPLVKNPSEGRSHQMGTCLIVARKKTLFFHILSDGDYSHPFRYEIGKEIIKLTSCSFTGKIAIGLKTGEIVLLHNIQDFLTHYWNKKSWDVTLMTQTNLHWHAHAVLSMQFSSDGKYLFSGGEENVLVLWQIRQMTSNFLPRLGAPLVHMSVSTDPNKAGKVLISGADNSIRWFNTATMTMEWYYQSVYITPYHHIHGHHHKNNAKKNKETNKKVINCRDALLESLYPSKLIDLQSDEYWLPSITMNRLSGTIATNGKSPCIQLFDPFLGIVRSNIDIVYFNRVSRKDSNKTLYVPSIPLYTFDTTGKVLITMDVMQGEELDKQYSLKFWEYGPYTNPKKVYFPPSYQLLTQLTAPHGRYPITQMKLHTSFPENKDYPIYSLATGSYDGTVKVWRGEYIAQKPMKNIFQKIKKTNGKEDKQVAAAEAEEEAKLTYKLTWKCAYSFQYRQTFVNAITWSPDGSVLIIAYEHLITFWDPETVELKKLLVVTPSTSNISKLDVIQPQEKDDEDVYLVVTTGSNILVYSLLSLQLLWQQEHKLITASIVATSSEFAYPNPKATTNINHGWIAVASAAASVKSETTYDLTIYSPLSSTPLLTQTLPAKALSLTFLQGKYTATLEEQQHQTPHGIVILTADSEVLEIHWSQDDKQMTTITNKTLAQVPKASLPALITREGEDSDVDDNKKVRIIKKQPLTEEDLMWKEKSKHFVTVSAAQGKQNWLERLLPENSLDLPKPSEIAVEFFNALIPDMEAENTVNTNQQKKKRARFQSEEDDEADDGVKIVRNPFDQLEATMNATSTSSSSEQSNTSVATTTTTATPTTPGSIPDFARTSLNNFMKRSFADMNTSNDDDNTNSNNKPVKEQQVEEDNKDKKKKKQKSSSTPAPATAEPEVVISASASSSEVVTAEEEEVAVVVSNGKGKGKKEETKEKKTKGKKGNKEEEKKTEEQETSIVQEEKKVEPAVVVPEVPVVVVVAKEPEAEVVVPATKKAGHGRGKKEPVPTEVVAPEPVVTAVEEKPVAMEVATTEEVASAPTPVVENKKKDKKKGKDTNKEEDKSKVEPEAKKEEVVAVAVAAKEEEQEIPKVEELAEKPKRGRKSKAAIIQDNVVVDNNAHVAMNHDHDHDDFATDDESVASQTRGGKRRRTLPPSAILEAIAEEKEEQAKEKEVTVKKSTRGGRGKKETVEPAPVPVEEKEQDTEKSGRRTTRATRSKAA